MRVYAIVDGDMEWLTRRVSLAVGWPINDNGVRVDGCGMDMSFHLMDVVARTLEIGDGNDFSIRYV